MTFEDRQAAYPGRYKVTPENGEAYIATLTRADEASVEGTPLNAETFNKMMKELMAHAGARNLLDNSNFAAPVNQRGYGNYVSGARYTIDRWKMAENLSVTVDNGFILLECSSTAETRNGFIQLFGKEKTPAAGTKITVAYEDDAGNIYVGTGTMPSTGSISIGNSINVYGADTDARVAFMVSPGTTVGLRWMAVYEGEYTKENLPAYRPKDYSAELMECMRYYQVRSTNDVAAVDLRPTMVAEPEITAVDGGYAYSADL